MKVNRRALRISRGKVLQVVSDSLTMLIGVVVAKFRSMGVIELRLGKTLFRRFVIRWRGRLFVSLTMLVVF